MALLEQRIEINTMNSRILAILATLVSLTGIARAHHSFSMFDAIKEVAVTGIVTEFQWTNPHTWIELDVTDEQGITRHWSIEGGSVVGLARQGWKKDTIKPGDRISVLMHPLRSGEPGGALMGVILADGARLGVPFDPPQR